MWCVKPARINRNQIKSAVFSAPLGAIRVCPERRSVVTVPSGRIHQPQRPYLYARIVRLGATTETSAARCASCALRGVIATLLHRRNVCGARWGALLPLRAARRVKIVRLASIKPKRAKLRVSSVSLGAPSPQWGRRPAVIVPSARTRAPRRRCLCVRTVRLGAIIKT